MGNPKQGKVAKYPSKYSDNYVTLAQFLAEMMCERRAASLKVDLPRYFWDSAEEWKSYYFYQLKLANKLLAVYNPGHIIRAVNELKYIYSLNIKVLLELLKKFKDEPEIFKEVVDQPIESSGPSGVFFRRKGILGKLDDWRS